MGEWSGWVKHAPSSAAPARLPPSPSLPRRTRRRRSPTNPVTEARQWCMPRPSRNALPAHGFTGQWPASIQAEDAAVLLRALASLAAWQERRPHVRAFRPWLGPPGRASFFHARPGRRVLCADRGMLL